MSVGSKIFTTLFLAAFVAGGVFIGITGIEDAQRRTDQQGWEQVPCEIVSSSVKIDSTSNEPYAPDIRFRYQIGGQSYQSATAIDGGLTTNDYAEAQDVSFKYSTGSAHTAMVNPQDPADAVLEPRSAAESLLFLLFPLAFGGIPLGIIIAIWWPRKSGALDDTKTTAISNQKTSKQLGPKGYLLVGALLLAVGVGIGIPLAVLPIMRTIDATSWVQTPCVVERSAVLTFDGDDGNTYRPDILYRYEHDGQAYRSNRLHLATAGSSSGYDGKREVVNAHPVGYETVCYVDPDRPSRATMNRGFTLAHLLGLIPLPFALGGLAMIVSGTKKMAMPHDWRQNDSGTASTAMGGSAKRKDPVESGPVVLRPRMSRLGKAVGLLLVGLFWNGIVSIFGNQVVQSYLRDDPDYFLTVFLIPFVLVGLLIMAGFVQAAMVVFAPVIEIGLDRRSIPLGGATALRWRVLGRPGRLHGLTITLVGTESAQYRRGTDTITDTNDFYTEHLIGGEYEDADADTDNPLSLPIDNDRGERALMIPADTMHSFDGGNNEVVWKLKVRAWVPRWPDPKDEYELEILPMEVEGG